MNKTNKKIFKNIFIKYLHNKNIVCTFTSVNSDKAIDIKILADMKTYSKKEFKKQYSEYRKHLKKMVICSASLYSQALDLNPLFRRIYLKHEYPVSVKIWLYLNK